MQVYEQDHRQSLHFPLTARRAERGYYIAYPGSIAQIYVIFVCAAQRALYYHYY